MSVRACQVTMAMEHPDCSQRVLMLKRMKGLNQQKRKCWTSKGAGTMAWSRVKRRVLLREDPESPWMSGRGGRVKTKVHRTSLNGSKQTSEEVTANNDDAFDQTGNFFFSCFDLLVRSSSSPRWTETSL